MVRIKVKVKVRIKVEIKGEFKGKFKSKFKSKFKGFRLRRVHFFLRKKRNRTKEKFAHIVESHCAFS